MHDFVIFGAAIFAPELLPALRQLGARVLAAGSGALGAVAAPVAFLGTIFIPTNRSLISDGAVPDSPDVSYRFDQGTGVLSLTRDRGDGDIDVLYSGRSGADGIFRDKDGNSIGSYLGGSAVAIDSDAIYAYEARRASKDSDAGTIAQSVTQSDRAKLCPDPGPDTANWPKRSERALAYQEQITGLPRGLAVDFKGVSFDGCRNGVLLEAKGEGFRWAMTGPDTWRRNYEGVKEIMGQAQRQSKAAADRYPVEWYFAEEPVANYFRVQFSRAGYSNITVFHAPLVKKENQ